MQQFLKILWWCKIWKWHDWTSAVEKGQKPSPEQLERGVAGFYEYATMYCDRCGKISDISKQLLCKYKNLD